MFSYLNTNYFSALCDDMTEALELNEVIWENISDANFNDVFTRFFNDETITKDFYEIGETRPIMQLIAIMNDASKCVAHLSCDVEKMEAREIDAACRRYYLAEVLTCVMKQAVEMGRKTNDE